jgi:hypothetical protein
MILNLVLFFMIQSSGILSPLENKRTPAVKLSARTVNITMNRIIPVQNNIMLWQLILFPEDIYNRQLLLLVKIIPVQNMK